MILARVQAHPSRGTLHKRLLPLLSPLPTALMLHSSDPPDPWEGYRRCLQNIPDGVTHVLVVQDDAIPCPGFPEAVVKVAARWDVPVCLFLGAYPASTAVRARRAKPDVRYVPLGPTAFVPLVCVLWPTAVAREFIRWSSGARGMTRADDGNAGRWAKATKQQIMVSVPSLVEHDDDALSVKGGRAHVPWAEGWRHAVQVAGNGSDHDW